MRVLRLVLSSAAVAGVVGCSNTTTSPPSATTSTRPAVSVPEAGGSAKAFDREGGNGVNGDRDIEASGEYQFFVPADFNGGIFGGSVDNKVEFEAHRNANGRVTGGFHYVQTFDGQPSAFSGRVTCLAIYDTPVLQRFPNITAKTQNRAKWGGLIEHSTDPTEPAGTYIWFQSIDNDTQGDNQPSGEPDLSTLSGFGDITANENFCASPNVPNPNFGPHAVQQGKIEVK
jgi:hypothetical protein